MLTSFEPNWNLPSLSGVRNWCPRSWPRSRARDRARSGWPTDSWIVSHRLVGCRISVFWPADRRLRLVHRDRFLGGDARFLEQRVGLDVFVARAHRRGQRVARVELAGRAVHRGDREGRIRADQRLLDVRAFGRGEVLLLVDELHEGRDEARARHFQRFVVDLQQQIELRLQRHVERVLLRPACSSVVSIGLDRRQPHRLGVDRAGWRARSRPPARRRARSRPWSRRCCSAKPQVPSTITRTPKP